MVPNELPCSMLTRYRIGDPLDRTAGGTEAGQREAERLFQAMFAARR
jgi:hypothetical protein